MNQDALIKQALNVAKFLKNIVFDPTGVFNKLKKGQLVFETYVVFLIGASITFFKTIRLRGRSIHFFEDRSVSQILSFFAIPQVKWVFVYIIYFLFVLILSISGRIFFKRIEFRPLFLCLMSISGIGIILQAVFFVLHYIIPQNINFYLTYVAFVWVVVLSLLAIKYSQEISISKSLLLLIIAGLPIIFIAGLTGISPYLAWLNF